MEISKTEIGNALTSADDNHILATANDIYDETQQAYQSEINESLKEDKQDKLVSGTNIKTINGTSLLGSGDVSIGDDANGSVDEGHLVWSQETILDNTTILDAIMRDTIGNKIAFMNRGGIQIEYSRDNGGTWVDYGADNATKTQLVTPIVGFAQLALGGRHTNDATALTDRLRVTLDAIEGDFYFRINKILIQVENGVNSLAKFMVDIEYKTYGGSDWIAYKTSQLAGSPGWSSIPVSNLPAWGYKSNPNIRYIRFTFRQEAFIQYKGRLRNIAIIGLKNTTGGNNLTNKGTIYSLDVCQNATFPNAVKGNRLITDGGKSTQVVKGDGSLEEESALAVASAIDAEHAEEADYAGVADKADKLTTARKIGITGGAVGTGTNFDGSASINIPVTTLYDTPLEYKTLSDRNTEAKGLTLIDAVTGQFTANRLAFKRPENILIEYSNDGGVNWNISSHTDKTKVELVSGIGANLYLGNKTTGQTIQDKLRITIFAAKDGLDFYSTWQRLYVYLSTNGAIGLHCTYEYSLRDTPDNWVSQGDWRMVGWSGWNKLSNIGSTAFGEKNSSSHPFAIRLTFWFVGHADGYENKTSTCIYKLELRGTTVYNNSTGCKLAETGHMYDYDWQKNTTFPANVTATKHITQGGTANQVTLGNGFLKDISELSPITDADAEILLDNHIHSINVNANGNDVNISVIESSKNGNTWETEEKNIPLPVATQDTAGIISAADKKKIDNINYEDNTLFVGDGTNGTLSIGHESSKASSEMRVQRDRYATIHVTSYSDTTGGSIAVMESQGGKGRMEVNGDQLAKLVLSGAGEVNVTLSKENEDGTSVETIIDAEEGITAPKFATIGGTSEQILLGDGTLITFDELKAKLGLI